MRLQPKSKMVISMLGYGTVLGGIAGALAMVILILSSDPLRLLSDILPVMLSEILSIASFGLILGGVFGMIAGIYSGLVMALMTSVFYADIPSYKGYKLAMGICATMITALYLYKGVWHLRLDGINPSAWNITMVLLVSLAIYASQQVASAYLVEWSIRKQKAYL